MNQIGHGAAGRNLAVLRRIVFSTAAAAFITLGTAAGIAVAQEGAKPLLPAQDRMQAPIGHRQPRAQDLPPKILNNEGSRTESEKEMDRRLNSICRGC
jgi:hypothetical protein